MMRRVIGNKLQRMCLELKEKLMFHLLDQRLQINGSMVCQLQDKLISGVEGEGQNFGSVILRKNDRCVSQVTTCGSD